MSALARTRPPRRRALPAAGCALLVPLLLGTAATPPPAAGPDPAREAARLSRELVAASTTAGALKHLRRFQEAADAAGGHRAAGSAGHEASASYVLTQLRRAGYDARYATFPFTWTETLAEKLAVVTPAPRDARVEAMTYTASTPEGGLTAELVRVPVDATPGCEAADYAGTEVTGRIALVVRGGCSFLQKQATAAAAGAAGALISNHLDGKLTGTLGDPAAVRIPTGGITRAEGERLAEAIAGADGGTVTVTLELRERQEERTTGNVVAQTPGGDPAHTVMFGAHLDSVPEGPGINDDGSGSAGLLDVALRLAATHRTPVNAVRFAWWSAEENGLVGSDAYVAGLTAADRRRIALYLNFDMIASPNGVQFVFDGDDSDASGAGPGPAGSAQLERGITAFLDRRTTPYQSSDFTGRSDYGPFIEAGIPSGGTDTGAEGIKSAAQAEVFGGTAGIAYDPCYHAACDTLSNVDPAAFETNIDVIADAVGTYSQDLRSLTGPLPAAAGTDRRDGGGHLRTGHGRDAA
ncbi:M20/M25/M40 family metallo-hydrolase [Streptomyces sp. AM 2-1-1]|uniref:M20/M25/M40 family metallo-hydrolase n=1 Tax=Streptomyces sp. AM 2-1-1 TaxID=3028709 RepID=UPI0023B9FB1B|nr:M20/M25/M40 family metallo-hydrolase [Streptomyces sp. AM 2-1-1]WEH40950.1 M20/M25/M40 family metallo-hydrolase [Streptomyces sp. AM 2-1-1]